MKELSTATRATDIGLPYYFDLQAELGATKHLGGLTATREMMSLCQITPDKTVLNVGCGAGVASAYVAETYGCRVVAVDILPHMVASAERWAHQKGVSDRMDFHLADAQDLPFDDNQFDSLICESVNTFVPDRAKAAAEYVRVVKPGGHVGICEAFWVKPPSPQIANLMTELTGQHIQTSDVWQRMLTDAGLSDLVVKTYDVTPRSEARDQKGFLSVGDYFRMIGRFFRVLFRDREARGMLKHLGSNPAEYFDYLGYGIYVGRKPIDIAQ